MSKQPDWDNAPEGAIAWMPKNDDYVEAWFKPGRALILSSTGEGDWFFSDWQNSPKVLKHIVYRPTTQEPAAETPAKSMAELYPQYYKDVRHIKVIDSYGVCKLFGVKDDSGALQHATKKLLLSGVRTGGKSAYEDVKEARDTLTRWLELEGVE